MKNMYRSHFSGFSIEKIKKLERSENKIILDQVFQELYDGDDPEVDEFVGARKVAEVFFNKSAKEAGFDNETMDHYYFMRALIYTQEEFTHIDFECSSGDLFDYLYDLQERLVGFPKQLISFFTNGRSIFSKQSASSPADYPYAILSLSEINVLLEDMESYPQKYKNNKNVYEWFNYSLKELDKKGLDLYFRTS